MTPPEAGRAPWRLPLLAAGGVALLAGLYGALLLLGFALPTPRPSLSDVHGPVMVLGFVGTLVCLERAVALAPSGRSVPWPMAGPVCAGLGAAVLVLAGPVLAGKLLLAAAGVLLMGIYRQLWRRQSSVALLAQGAGALAWYAATLLWLGGLTVPQTVPWLATFVVATVAGERLELARVVPAGPSRERWFLAALAVLLAGATATVVWPAVGGYLFGLGLLAVLAWLLVFDVARRLVRVRGLPRYIAAGLLAGYAWLGLAGLLWAGGGQALAGARYDAATHAVFLGFTMSMIFVHAPVMLPAVLHRPLPYQPILYLPLAALHMTLLVRVVLGDAAGVEAAWRWAGAGNVAAVLSFVALAAVLAARPVAARPAGRTAAVGVAR